MDADASGQMNIISSECGKEWKGSALTDSHNEDVRKKVNEAEQILNAI